MVHVEVLMQSSVFTFPSYLHEHLEVQHVGRININLAESGLE